MEESYSTTGDYGLSILSDPENANVDIVFVHGLTGNRETTWTHGSTKKFWPQDFLPKDLPTARIMTFGYDTDVIGALRVASSNTLRDHGKALADELAVWRKMSRSNRRPLIFVAHGLGGLVTEQALLISRGAAQQYYKDVYKAAKALPLARLANALRKNREIVKVLTPGSEMLAALQQEFHTMLEDWRRNHGKTIEMFCFYEELEVNGVGKIVSDQSAILPSCQNRSIHGNHMQMTRFSSPMDPGYKAVSNTLWVWVDELENQQVQVPVRGANSKPIYMIESGGAPVKLGNTSAGQNFSFNSNNRY
ncbi:hypothetical protein PITC_023280 [Penicillium italicum]|uniref:DUF676 domain-containing protein n=1 Tax=Penicillium italicum TaxID=40296 RepID=A0A0A2LBB4_PENIT|nr:hypothetical protein PITC_023280 [Penicillium italicum]